MTPNYPKPPHCRYFVSHFDIFVVGRDRDFKFGTLVDRSKCYSPPVKRRGRSHEPFKFWWAPTIKWFLNHIFGMAGARVIKFCMHVRYVKSQHKDDKSPLKGAWSRSRDPLLILTPNHIFGTAEARIIKLCTQVDCMKS